MLEGGIPWCFSEETSIQRETLKELGLKIQYQEGVLGAFKNPRGEPCLFILDGLWNDVYWGRQMRHLFTKGSHHRNISVIQITQKISHQDRHCTEISLKVQYMVRLKNVSD